jgi:hypothetical protein
MDQHNKLWGIKNDLVCEAAQKCGLIAQAVAPGWLWYILDPKQDNLTVGFLEHRVDRSYRKWESMRITDDEDYTGATVRDHDHVVDAVARFA